MGCCFCCDGIDAGEVKIALKLAMRWKRGDVQAAIAKLAPADRGGPEFFRQLVQAENREIRGIFSTVARAPVSDDPRQTKRWRLFEARVAFLSGWVKINNPLASSGAINHGVRIYVDATQDSAMAIFEMGPHEFARRVEKLRRTRDKVRRIRDRVSAYYAARDAGKYQQLH